MTLNLKEAKIKYRHVKKKLKIIIDAANHAKHNIDQTLKELGKTKILFFLFLFLLLFIR